MVAEEAEERGEEAEEAEDIKEGEGTGDVEPLGLSEHWSVEAKHSGCYTGGKVTWVEAAQLLGCLSSEELHLVDVATQLPTRQVSQESDGILTFAIDPAGKNACTTHRSGLLRHFRLENSTLVRSWTAHTELVVDVCFDATGAMVASGSVDFSAKVWDFTGYFCTHNFTGHVALVSIVRFHPSQLQLVTIASAEVRLWDLKSSTCVGVMKDHLGTISSLSFIRVKGVSHSLITGGRDQVVNIWKFEEKCALARTIPVFETVEGVVAVNTRSLRAASAEGKSPLAQWLRTEAQLPAYLIFTAGSKAQLRVWSPTEGSCVAEAPSPHGAKGAFRGLHCLDEAASRRLLTIGDDLNLVVWSLPEMQVVSYIMGHNGEIAHVQFIPELKWPKGGTAKVSASRFVCITNDEHPRVVNCHGFGAQMLRGHTEVVIACDVSPDGQWIATGGMDQSIRVWSAAQATCVCCLQGHAGPVSALSFPKKRPRARHSAQGKPLMLVSGGRDKIMKIWELESAAKLKERLAEGGSPLEVAKAKVTVVGHSKEVSDVAVAPNNKLIASGGQDKLVRIWSFPQGDLLGECTGHRRAVWCVAFSPVDQVVASASGDTTVRIWNLKDYTPIRAFQGHTGAVLRVCFLASGMQMMTGGADGLLKLWQIRTADCAASFEEHSGKVWCVDILGSQMVSCGTDSALCVWRDSTEEFAKKKRDETAERALKDTQIGLLLHEGKIAKALTLALDLNRPAQMREILVKHTLDVVDQCLKGSDRAEEEKGAKHQGKGGLARDTGQAPSVEAAAAKEPTPNHDVDLRAWVLSLTSAQLEKLVNLLEQWNSNRRMASIAQMLMSLVLLAVPPSQLMKLEGMNATCGNILSYSTRHMARVESLLQKTFLFDLVLQSGTTGLALPDEANGKAGNDESIAGHPEHTPEDALKRTMDVLLGEEDEEDKILVDQEEEEDNNEDEEDKILIGQEDEDNGEDAVNETEPAESALAESVADGEGTTAEAPKKKRRRKGGKPSTTE